MIFLANFQASHCWVLLNLRIIYCSWKRQLLFGYCIFNFHNRRQIGKAWINKLNYFLNLLLSFAKKNHLQKVWRNWRLVVYSTEKAPIWIERGSKSSPVVGIDIQTNSMYYLKNVSRLNTVRFQKVPTV